MHTGICGFVVVSLLAMMLNLGSHLLASLLLSVDNAWGEKSCWLARDIWRINRPARLLFSVSQSVWIRTYVRTYVLLVLVGTTDEMLLSFLAK